MILTRKQAFDELRSNLELTGLQKETVANRQKSVRNAVSNQLTIADDFLTGSYKRSTLIGPLKSADVDILIVLDSEYRGRGPKAVLELVRKALLDEYRKGTKISRNGQAVTITFTDFIVDVVPAFVRPWWAWNTDNWDICDSASDRWISTNPKRHVDISSRANKLHDGQLVPRIKQLKAWNRAVGEPLRSFHIEALTWSIFGRSSWWYSTQSSDWDSASYFFKKARKKLRQPLHDPAGTGSDVAAYLHDTTLDTAVKKIDSAYQRCINAEKASKNGELDVMHNEYAKVFGDSYPS